MSERGRASEQNPTAAHTPTAAQSPTAGQGRTRDVPQTALPPVYARVLAFGAVLLAGAAGGFIGYAFATLGNFGSVATGIITLLCGLGFAAGIAVVAVLTLRAIGEWRTIRDRTPQG